MTRALVSLLLLFTASQAAGQDSPSEPARPNIVFILADDCTYRDIGCYGGQAHTPHLDELARQGIRLTRCFQASAMCSPTRHCLYTGRYPVSSGAYPNHTFVKAGVRSVVHELQPHGYRVALSGKSHVGPREAFPFEVNGRGAPDMKQLGAFFEECTRSGTPFCQFVCSRQPHSPWNKGDASRYPADEVVLPEYFVDTPATRDTFSRYLAEITYFDAQVGAVLDLIDEQGLAETTLVMVATEQGSGFPFAKWTCYDSGLQSALVVRWPGRISPGTSSSALVEYVDVLPTILEAAGLEPPAELEGRSMLSVLRGETQTHKQYVFGIQTSRGINKGPDWYGSRSVRSARYKLIRNLTPEATFRNAATATAVFQEWRALAQGDEDALALVERYQHRPELELYDLELDPYEQRDLAQDAAYAEQLTELAQQLEAWMERQGDAGQLTELAAGERMLGGAARIRRNAERNASQPAADRR